MTNRTPSRRTSFSGRAVRRLALFFFGERTEHRRTLLLCKVTRVRINLARCAGVGKKKKRRTNTENKSRQKESKRIAHSCESQA